MKSVIVPRVGEPEVFEFRESPEPEPGRGLVRVQVKASGINFADCMARMGMYPGAPKTPFVPGLEVAGVVDAVGEGADRSWMGKRVVAPMWFGGYSSAVVVDPADCIPMPDAASFEEGAALAVTYLTALHGLYFLANLQPGDDVLVHTAAGGVGTAAVQLALLRGATVIGTASGSKHDFLKKMGVAHCIDYTKADFEEEVMKLTHGKGVRVIMDPVGGRAFEKSYRCLRKTGVLLMYGLSAASTGESRNVFRILWEYLTSPRFGSMRLMSDNKGVFGYHLGRLDGERATLRREARELAELWHAGKITPVVGKVFPHTEAAAAHRYMQDRKNIGKIVLTF